MFVCCACLSIWIPKLKIKLWTSCVVFRLSTLTASFTTVAGSLTQSVIAKVIASHQTRDNHLWIPWASFIAYHTRYSLIPTSLFKRSSSKWPLRNGATEDLMRHSWSSCHCHYPPIGQRQFLPSHLSHVLERTLSLCVMSVRLLSHCWT